MKLIVFIAFTEVSGQEVSLGKSLESASEDKTDRLETSQQEILGAKDTLAKLETDLNKQSLAMLHDGVGKAFMNLTCTCSNCSQ